MLKILVAIAVLLLSGCTYTINYTIVWFEANSVGEKAKVDISMDSQFATTKTVSPATELSVPISALKELQAIKERELKSKDE